jgi:hypothetical protein
MFNFKDACHIEKLLQNTDDNHETKRLLKKFTSLKSERAPFYLTAKEFEEVLRWKLRSQYGRTSEKRKRNTPTLIETVTKAAFSISHPDEEMETRFKLHMLRTLIGVETAVASAILALCYPERYGVVDFRIWRQLFGEERKYFTTSDYIQYLTVVRELAAKYGYTVQQIDQAIWQYDIETKLS